MINLVTKVLADEREEVNEISQSVLTALFGAFGIEANQLFIWAIGIGAVLAFGIIVYSGVLWSVSLGGESVSKAKRMIKNAIYGLLLLIGAYLILFTINPELVRL